MATNNTSVLNKSNTSVVCFFNTHVLDLTTMNYGERLRLARKHKKLTQDALANLSGVNQVSISKIERGDQEYSIYDVELSYALDIQAMWLRTGDVKFAPDWVTGKDEIKTKFVEEKTASYMPEKEPTISAKEKEILDFINALPSFEQDKVARELKEKARYFKQIYEDMDNKKTG